MVNNEENTHRPESKRSLSDKEKAAIAAMKKRNRSTPGPLFRSPQEPSKGNLEVALNERLENNDAIDLFDSRLMEVTGIADSSVGLGFLSKAANATLTSIPKGAEIANHMESFANSMRVLSPQDEYEGQLIAQLVVLHTNAMNWLGRAMKTDRVDFANIYLNGASKLLTRHHEALDSLLKYRRRGEQRVYVEHVHVHGGAQAVVGNISAATGGRINDKNEEGPLAKV